MFFWVRACEGNKVLLFRLGSVVDIRQHLDFMETKTELLDETQHSERNHGNRSTNHSQAGTYQYLPVSKYRHLYVSPLVSFTDAWKFKHLLTPGKERIWEVNVVQFDPPAGTWSVRYRVLQTGHGGGYSLLSLLLLLVQVSTHKHSHLTTGPALLTLQQVGQE